MCVFLLIPVVLADQYGTFGGPRDKQHDCSNYYADFDASLTGSSLQQAIHDLVSPHTVIPYDGRIDAYHALEFLDEDPHNSSNVIGIYSLTPSPKVWHNSKGWNREHLWPQSRGLYDHKTEGADRSDLHALRACDWNLNSDRSNQIYKDCEGLTEHCAVGHQVSEEAAPTVAEDEKLDYWRPPVETRGDIARALFYMEVRYDGVDDGTTDLTLVTCTDDIGVGTPYMADLDDLIKWHCEDPVDDAERKRNLDVCTYWQGNRNPFVDFPNLVKQYFVGIAQARCALCPNEPCTLLNAFDSCDVIEEPFVETPEASSEIAPQSVFINEIHYDNEGRDVDEFVEIAGPMDFDFAGWELVLYRSDGTAYFTKKLEDATKGIAVVYPPSIQNGPGDGMALVDPAGNVVQFLSYEGTLTGKEGPAAGLTSTDIGVKESATSPPDASLQLAGSGKVSSDFTWKGPSSPSTPGTVNWDQSFFFINEL